MSTSHRFPLLALALAACAGDRSPTAPPPPAEDTRASDVRASLAPAKPAWMPSRILGFTRVSGRDAAASASALPYSGVFCYDAGSGSYEWTLRIPPASFALMQADSARVYWSLKERHYRPKGGQTSIWVVADASLDLAALNLSHVHTSHDSTTYPDGLLRYFQPMSDAVLRKLALTGGTMRVLINATATARVPDWACGQYIAAAHAKLEMYTPPQLHIFD